MLKIKLFAAAAFLAFVSGAFLLSSDDARAQSRKNSENRDAVLEKVAGYKQWQEVRKPEKKSDEPSIILNSTAMG